MRGSKIGRERYGFFEGPLGLRGPIIAQQQCAQMIVEPGVRGLEVEGAPKVFFRFPVLSFIRQACRVQEERTWRARIEFEGVGQNLARVLVAAQKIVANSGAVIRLRPLRRLLARLPSKVESLRVPA